MKNFILLFSSVLLSLHLSGQPVQFMPAPCFADNGFNAMSYAAVLGMIGSGTVGSATEPQPVEPGVDWIAAIDAQGYVVGVEQAAPINGFYGCTMTVATVSLEIAPEPQYFFGVPPNPCPTAPYGGSNNEVISIVVYDNSRDMFFTLANTLSFTAGGLSGNINAGNSTCEMEDFPMVYSVPANPLPVVLTAFRGTASGNQVELSWTTATEQNSDYFSIERSQEGEVWRSVGTVEAAGNSDELLNYAFADINPNVGQNLYRLRQLDFDGSEYYSNVIAVDFNRGNGPKEVNVFPNPVINGQLSLTVSGSWNGETTSSLFDINGRQVATWNNPGNGSKTVDLPQLPAGVYQLSTTDGLDRQTVRVVIR